MAKYRLKDQELQKKLDEITNGGFSKRLEYGLVSKEYPAEIYCVSCDLYAGTKRGRIEIRLTCCEIETVQKYDPNAWNSYPDVTPPEGVLMRVEFEFEGILRRSCAIFENGAWYIAADRKAFYDFTIDNVKRYRPWE